MSPFLERGPWLKFLAPLPQDVQPERKPVAAPGTPGAAPGSPIAGWENVMLDLSAAEHGLRVILVTLDATGTAISASDHVLLSRTAGDGQKVLCHESLGGRIESDGSFLGMHWIAEGPEPAEDEGPETRGEDDPPWGNPVHRPPTAAEVERLLAIAADVVARASRQ